MLAAAAQAAGVAATKNAPTTLTEINIARTEPKKYAEHLKPMLKSFDGKKLQREGQVTLITQEGAAAVEEAIKFLESMKPLPATVALPAAAIRCDCGLVLLLLRRAPAALRSVAI